LLSRSLLSRSLPLRVGLLIDGPLFFTLFAFERAQFRLSSLIALLNSRSKLSHLLLAFLIDCGRNPAGKRLRQPVRASRADYLPAVIHL